MLSTAACHAHIGDLDIKTAKRKAYSAADRSFADNDRKKKRSKRKNKNVQKGVTYCAYE
jgi:hypothetical protein